MKFKTTIALHPKVKEIIDILREQDPEMKNYNDIILKLIGSSGLSDKEREKINTVLKEIKQEEIKAIEEKYDLAL